MFERFTDRARRVVVLAQEEACLLNHNYIGTEHLLLGMVKEGEGIAARALLFDLDVLRGAVEEIIGRGTASPRGSIPFTPRAKGVIERALREALEFGHNYIGNEHLLLALLSEGEGVGAQIIVGQGGELDTIRKRVIDLIGQTVTVEPQPTETRSVEDRCVVHAVGNMTTAKHLPDCGHFTP